MNFKEPQVSSGDREFATDPALKARLRAWAEDIDFRSTSNLSTLILSAYRIRRLRKISLLLLRRLEGSEMNSRTLRRILRDYHGVMIGDYSYGACTEPGLLPSGTVVGNYCSTAEGLRVFRRNHPASHLSQHPYFYNKKLGLVLKDSIQDVTDNPLHIGNDVWIGAGVTILPGCQQIGDGAIIGAGAVVTRDVEPFSIHAGNPARRIGQRFSDEICKKIQSTGWWHLPIAELAEVLPLFCKPANEVIISDLIAGTMGGLDRTRGQNVERD